MDYPYYRDTDRAPSDRAYPKDESRDNFYRGRSPGFDRPARGERRPRSRSPNNIDRYEPTRGDRGGRGGREDFGGGRDRDDRRGDRRERSPPANIDRYVPGQESGPPPPQVNPLMDPVKLPYQVGFSYFGEWWRMNEKIKEERERQRTGRRREPDRNRGPEDREKEKAKIQAAYDTYKEELQAKMARSFVTDHKKEQWFRERYVPEIRDNFRASLNEFRRGAYSQWEQDLESGTFDEFSLEGLPKAELNGQGNLVEKEEGEATAANEILGVGDLVPVNGADIRDENLFQPTLLFKTIAPHVSRANLELFCKEHLGEEEGGFKWLSLSDPNPSKRYHRIGWVMLHPSSDAAPSLDRPDPRDEEGEMAGSGAAPASTAEKALDAINGKTVKDEVRGDFVCHVGVHNPPHSPRKKALWDLFSAPERVDKDLGLAQRLINRFEEEIGSGIGPGSDFNGILKIEERVEDLRSEGRLQPAMPTAPKKPKKSAAAGMDDSMADAEQIDLDEEEGEEDEGAVDEDEDEVDDENILVKKKQLDLMIEYLRRVFNFCFYCVFESDSVHELTRKCPGGHLRRPRSTLSTAAKGVARASALGEPFPGKKRGEPDEEGEVGEPGEKKFRGAGKAEQQLLRAFNWVKTFEDKLMQILEPESVDLRKLGGKPVDEGLEEEMAKFVKQEDEHKFRCKVPDCTKLFKEDHFWKKHVEKRHTEWLDGIKQEFELVNAYVLDPAHIAPSRTDANSNGHFPPSNGQNATGTPRGFNLNTFNVNSMMPVPGFPMPAGGLPPFMGGQGGWNGGDSRDGPGPIRRGGMGGRGGHRSGPYDRRPNQRWESGGGRGGGRGGAGKWGDGASGGGATVGPREATQGRTIKSYEDLDHVGGSGGGELNY